MSRNASEKVRVDREEYEALVALRDVEHDKLRVLHTRAKSAYEDIRSTCISQADRLARQDLELKYARETRKIAEDQNVKLKLRIAALEAAIKDGTASKMAPENGALFGDVLPHRRVA